MILSFVLFLISKDKAKYLASADPLLGIMNWPSLIWISTCPLLADFLTVVSWLGLLECFLFGLGSKAQAVKLTPATSKAVYLNTFFIIVSLIS